MTFQSTPQKQTPWHRGEIALQDALGVTARMETQGAKVIRDFMPDQHRSFYAQLPFIAVGSVDPSGDAWATLLAAAPGFVSSPDSQRLDLTVSRDPSDPASAGLGPGDAVGMLGIELHSRRRNRVNGTVARADGTGFSLSVEHAFGNCPQYIQRRDWRMETDPALLGDGAAIRSDGLDAVAQAMIAEADTFFVASYADLPGGRQVDVSHRGGKAGFVRLDADGGLTIPDFAGNLHFNTLGNFLENPNAGLTFVDFETGDMLQMTGRAQVILDSPEIAAFQGAERLWRFVPRIVVRRPRAMPLRWAFTDFSPNSLMTGSWDEAAERLKAETLRNTWRPFRVARVVDESAAIRSFHLEPADKAGLNPHRAGQHLPIRLDIPGQEQPVVRTYTLSTAPSDGAYRISVKRDGLASTHLHDRVRAGDIIEARAPAGSFTIDAAATRPAVLMAAGVGITPILSMLRHIVHEGLRTGKVRPTWVFVGARTRAERAFDDEIAELVKRADGTVRLVRVLSRPETDAERGQDFDAVGRVDIALLKRTLPFDDYDFYLCGPASFMQAAYDGLRDTNVADARIHAETFGPSGLTRRPDAAAPAAPTAIPATAPVPVAFAASAKEARWSPEAGSLLDLAEARGLTPEFGCRGGSCGACRTPVLEGSVAYTTLPSAEVGDDEALICCAVPAESEDGRTSRLILDL